MNKKPFIKKTEKLFMFLICFGIALIGAGSIVKGIGHSSRFFEFAAGIGCAAVGWGSVCLILFKKKPEIAQRQEIEQNDERNTRIREKSGYNTFVVMLLYLLVAEVVFLALDVWIGCLVVICSMTIHVGSFLIFLCINSKKM